MRKGRVFFHPIDGTGVLTISWSSKPKGDAVEAKKGSGVGFFSELGELLCVIFDEVQENQDHQTLEFDRYSVEISMINGKISHSVKDKRSKLQLRKKQTKRRSKKMKK